MTSVGARSRLRSQPRRANGLAAASRLASFSDGGGDRLRAGGARAASRASRTQSAVSYFESSWSRPPRPSSARRDRRRRRCTEVIGEVCRSLASGEGVVKTRRMLLSFASVPAHILAGSEDNVVEAPLQRLTAGLPWV